MVWILFLDHFCHFLHIVNFVLFHPQSIDSGYLVNTTPHTIFINLFETLHMFSFFHSLTFYVCVWYNLYVRFDCNYSYNFLTDFVLSIFYFRWIHFMQNL